MFPYSKKGIEFGLWACRFLEHTKYKWCPLVTEESIPEKFQYCNMIKLIQPKSWVRVQWEAGSSIQKFVQLLFIILCLNIAEMNAFLLKLYLWIPTEHWWNLARLIFHYLISLPAVRQYYFYVTDPNINRMGSQLFVVLFILILEVTLVYKTAPDDIPPAPLQNKIAWATSAVVAVASTFLIIQKFE